MTIFRETAAAPPAEQFAMLLRFIGDDLDAASARARAAWSSRLKALGLRPLASSSGRLRLRFMTVGTFEALTLTTLKSIQNEVNEGIRHAVLSPTEEVLHWPLPDLTGGGMTRDTESGGFIWNWGIAGLKWPIVLAVAQLVAEHAERIRACRVCGRIFLAVKRQEYCSAEHSQQARDQRKKERGT
jgi:hypothetical protein